MQLHLACSSLGVYRNLLKDPVVGSLQGLLTLLNDKDCNPLQLTDLYFNFLSQVANLNITAEPLSHRLTLWQNHLLSLVLYDDNPFTRAAAQGKLNPQSALVAATAFDLTILELLYRLDWDQLSTQLGNHFGLDTGGWPSCAIYPQVSATQTKLPVLSLFEQTNGWEQLVSSLANHHAHVGAGIFGRFQAFKWTGSLEGIANPDPITLDNLVGYQSQKQQVVQNTQQFLKGYPANNLLLYGDRGTGKSATVKALLDRFGQEGLRLIELQKDYLAQLPQLLRVLHGHPQKFIIFIDDLSFEEFELEYKALKAVLEGSLEVRPANVLVYATSNRRHLIKEFHGDKLPPSDELHHQDTVQEKLSLADRFGQTITYIGPLQQEYLQIVEGLAAQRGLAISRDELHRLALQWELSHNVRSGRTAKQFVDHLEGQLLLQN